MNKFTQTLRRVVFAVLLAGVLLLSPIQAAQAVSADYSSHPGAPDNPNAKQKTLFQGRGDRNVVNGGDVARSSDRVVNKIEKTLNNSDSDRPKTTGEWNREAEQTEDKPGTRAERIAKETGEAVKDFGEMYQNTAERSGKALQEQTR